MFEAPLAAGMLGAFVQAVSGGALYRKTSFLVDSLGKPVFAPHIQMLEDPHVKRARWAALLSTKKACARNAAFVVKTASCEAISCRPTRRASSACKRPATRAARTTCRCASTQTRPEDDFEEMLKKLGTGLLLTELMGQGVNYVTGDYSRGASGFWVENGKIQYPVEEITVASTLQEMFRHIVAIGAIRSCAATSKSARC
jgi:PmbA protein